MLSYRYAFLTIVSLLLFAGCAQRIGDFTLISTKNVEYSVKYKMVGRFTGEERVVYFIIPWGVPNIKNAVDRAIEAGKGAYLANAVLESYSGLFQIGYNITGDVFVPVSQADLLNPAIEKYDLIKSGEELVLKGKTGTFVVK